MGPAEGEQTMSEPIESRLVELEIRSEERREDVSRLEAFVQGYEQRIALLERQVKQLRTMIKDGGLEGLPPALEDLPPHY